MCYTFKCKCCRSPHGERGLKWIFTTVTIIVTMSRSPHGERGLKYNLYLQNFIKHLSLSSRRAWIEIDFCPAFKKNHISRSPHGERGLKCKSKHLTQQQTAGRSPHGERGLKWKQRCFRRICRKVALLTESVD